jgi:hypothetical protein
MCAGKKAAVSRNTVTAVNVADTDSRAERGENRFFHPALPHPAAILTTTCVSFRQSLSCDDMQRRLLISTFYSYTYIDRFHLFHLEINLNRIILNGQVFVPFSIQWDFSAELFIPWFVCFPWCLSNDSRYKQERKEGLRTREKMNRSYRALLPGPDTNFGPVQPGKFGKGKTWPQTIQYLITLYCSKQAAEQFGHLKSWQFC